MVVPEIERAVDDAVRASLRAHPRVVLAVSGGSDSMALLASVATVATSDAHVVVATFDHGTGASASAAVAHVRRAAAYFGLPLRAGCATGLAKREAAWRSARWDFLRSVSATERATVVTAHTQDDHLETVVMRALRGAGARGLAGLLARSDIARPLLSFTRSALVEYARRRGASWIYDPSNADPAFLRNRVRHDLLPALIRARPGLRADFLALAARAAVLRTEVENLAEQVSELEPRSGDVTVSAETISHLDVDGLAVLWPALLARANAVADRRGIIRVTAWSRSARSGTSVPLSGGVEVMRRRDDFLVRRVQPPAGDSRLLTRDGVTEIGQWRFYPIEGTTIRGIELVSDPYQAALDANPSYEVRGWRPGDRLQVHPTSKPRRVARYFEDAGVSGPERKGWPVVASGEEIVWIPGVRRGHAATARPGGPYVVYQCERNVSRSET
ncbi:MAG: tRNA lysidine(34) synthetase TilS [Gemmatimonadaceae bacterium]